MTKKHFKVIAQIVGTIAESDERLSVAVQFVGMFRDANPRFKEDLFLELVNSYAESEASERVDAVFGV
jgi:hypothetical protein